MATILIDDVTEAAQEIRSAGGQLVEGPMAGPNGPRLLARHPDGAVFEYLEIPS